MGIFIPKLHKTGVKYMFYNINRNDMDLRQGYQKRMGELIAEYDFQQNQMQLRQMEIRTGLQTGRYQVLPNGQIKKFY